MSVVTRYVLRDLDWASDLPGFLPERVELMEDVAQSVTRILSEAGVPSGMTSIFIEPRTGRGWPTVTLVFTERAAAQAVATAYSDGDAAWADEIIETITG